MTHIVLGRSLLELKWLGDRFAFGSRSIQINNIRFSDVGKWESIYFIFHGDNEVESSHRAGTVISV